MNGKFIPKMKTIYCNLRLSVPAKVILTDEVIVRALKLQKIIQSCPKTESPWDETFKIELHYSEGSKEMIWTSDNEVCPVRIDIYTSHISLLSFYEEGEYNCVDDIDINKLPDVYFSNRFCYDSYQAKYQREIYQKLSIKFDEKDIKEPEIMGLIRTIPQEHLAILDPLVDKWRNYSHPNILPKPW